jgi:hypothetical protein
LGRAVTAGSGCSMRRCAPTGRRVEADVNASLGRDREAEEVDRAGSTPRSNGRNRRYLAIAGSDTNLSSATSHKPWRRRRPPAQPARCRSGDQSCGTARRGLLVVDDGERARPVRAPQAAIETQGIEHDYSEACETGLVKTRTICPGMTGNCDIAPHLSLSYIFTNSPPPEAYTKLAEKKAHPWRLSTGQSL